MNDVPRMIPSPHSVEGRPVAYVLPRPIGVDDLSKIGTRIARSIERRTPGLLHLMAIAKSGYPIAIAAAFECERLYPEMHTFVSGVDPFAPLNTFDDLPASASALTIMIDNSIKTGQTAVHAIKVAAASGIKVDVLMKLVDYGDDAERDSLSYIKSAYPLIEVRSLYGLGEIAHAPPAGRQ